jgi:hypothetical protein
MKPRISAHDLQQLSLYLDKQLSPVAKQRLEQRLHESQPLRKAFEELRETRRVLRAMPKVYAPRNFTLTPQMVDNRPLGRAYPVMGFVSALASFMFILVLAGDLLGFFARQSRSVSLQEVSQYEAAAPAMENVQEKSVQAEPSTLAPSLVETQRVTVEELKAAEPAGVLTTPPQATQTAIDLGADETTALPLTESYAKEAPAPSLGTANESASGEAITTTEILEMELLPIETPTAQAVTETWLPQPASSAQETAPTPSATPQEAALAALPAAAEDVAVSEGNTTTETTAKGDVVETTDQERLVTGEEAAGSQDRKPAESLPGRWILWIVEGILALIALISGALFVSRRRRQTR